MDPTFFNTRNYEKSVLQAQVILNALQTVNRSHTSNIITGDESWLLYVNRSRARWFLADDYPGDIVQKSDFQKKIMSSIFIRKNGTFFGSPINGDYV